MKGKKKKDEEKDRNENARKKGEREILKLDWRKAGER